MHRLMAVVALAGCTHAPAAYRQSVDAGASGAFIVVGDLQTTSAVERAVCREQNDEARKKIVAAIADQQPPFIVVLGDFVFHGEDAGAWADLDALIAKWQPIPIFPVAGNHEYWGDNAAGMRHFEARFGANTARYRKHGRLGLIWLDSNIEEMSWHRWKQQRRWYEAVLRHADADQTIDGVIVFLHHPPYTNSDVTSDEEHVRRYLLPAFYRARKSLAMISGHAHGYERFEHRGKSFIVSGGGGGPRVEYEKRHNDVSKQRKQLDKRPHNFLRVEANRTALHIEAIGVDGAEVDTVTIPFPSAGPSK